MIFATLAALAAAFSLATLTALAAARGSLSAATAGEKSQAGTRHDNRYNFHSRVRKTNHRRP